MLPSASSHESKSSRVVAAAVIGVLALAIVGKPLASQSRSRGAAPLTEPDFLPASVGMLARTSSPVPEAYLDDGTKPFDLIRTYQYGDRTGAQFYLILAASPDFIKDFSGCFQFYETMSRSELRETLASGRFSLPYTRWVFRSDTGKKTILCQWFWFAGDTQPTADPKRAWFQEVRSYISRAGRAATFMTYREVPAATPDDEAAKPIRQFIQALPYDRMKAWVDGK
jgi:hypothetical protein